ncbi:MAG TPA: glycoside hydrolase domain-containing protein [Bradyrhizobium sp.]|jgi:hypothetical protein|nr:glycoside hydrolase domain-containing protein [Bradyrhizobium sp.]
MIERLETSDLDIAEFEYESRELEYAKISRSFPIVDASVRTDRVVACLKSHGISTVIRYYCRDPNGSWKTIKKNEAEILISNQMRLAIVHEVGSSPSLFSYASGSLDAEYCIKYGQQTIGQPKDSAIYFAVDFDADAVTIRNRIIPYFQAIRDRMGAAGSPYKIGAYGSGLTCSTLLAKGLTAFTWLAQSTGWREYKTFLESGLWSLVQKPVTHVCNIEVDFDEAHTGKDFGAFSSLDAAIASAGEEAEAQWEDLVGASALDGVVPDMKARVLLLIQESTKKHVKMVPASGVRTPQSQAKLWKQSRTKAQAAAAVTRLRSGGARFLADILEATSAPKGPHVTNALPGMSWHQWGEAVDCYWEVNGKPEWDPDAIHSGVQGYHVYADLAETKAIGLTAGGHWKTFKDWPHVQLRPAASPLNVYTVAEIDRHMREKYGDMLELVAESDAPAPSIKGENESLIETFRSVISNLRNGSETPSGGKPYLFPDGIYKVEVAIGVAADSAPSDAIGLPIPSARVIVSGIKKEE